MVVRCLIALPPSPPVRYRERVMRAVSIFCDGSPPPDEEDEEEEDEEDDDEEEGAGLFNAAEEEEEGDGSKVIEVEEASSEAAPLVSYCTADGL